MYPIARQYVAKEVLGIKQPLLTFFEIAFDDWDETKWVAKAPLVFSYRITKM